MSTMKVHHTLYLSFLVVILIGCASSIEEYESIKPAHNLTQDELHARFFGTSTIYLSDSRNALIIDGFFTRQGFIETFFERMHSKTQELRPTYFLKCIRKHKSFVRHAFRNAFIVCAIVQHGMEQ